MRRSGRRLRPSSTSSATTDSESLGFVSMLLYMRFLLLSFFNALYSHLETALERLMAHELCYSYTPSRIAAGLSSNGASSYNPGIVPKASCYNHPTQSGIGRYDPYAPPRKAIHASSSGGGSNSGEREDSTPCRILLTFVIEASFSGPPLSSK